MNIAAFDGPLGCRLITAWPCPHGRTKFCLRDFVKCACRFHLVGWLSLGEAVNPLRTSTSRCRDRGLTGIDRAKAKSRRDRSFHRMLALDI